MPVRAIQPPANTIRITILPNKTFRGVLHFQEMDYDASTDLAVHTVKRGDARYNIPGMTVDQLNNWYEEIVGYRPQADDPELSDDDLRSLCVEVETTYAMMDAEASKA